MSAPLPDHLDPWRAVKNGFSFAGEVALSRLTRVAAAVIPGDEGSETRVGYRLRFERDRDGRAVAVGSVQSRLRLPCQRCLGDVVIEVDAPLRVGLVRTEQVGDELPGDLDPLIVDDELLNPLELIEDELLLAIPTVPRHASGLCEPPGGALAVGASETSGRDPDGQGDVPHPFAALAALKGH